MSGWHGALRCSPSPYDSSRARPRRRSPSASSSVLPPLHWPRDASTAVQPHKHSGSSEAPTRQHSPRRSQRERSRRRSPSPPARARLDSHRTAAHTHDRHGDLRSIDVYNPPVRRRRSHSPRPPTTSCRRSSRSRSPRRSGPRDGRALDDRHRGHDADERVAWPAAASGWEAAYESISRRQVAQPALEGGSRPRWAAQADMGEGRSRYEDWDAPRWAESVGAGRMGHEEEGTTRRDDSWTWRGLMLEAAPHRARSNPSGQHAAASLPRPPPHLSSRDFQVPHQQSYHSGLVGPSYIEFSPSPAPSLGRSPSRLPIRPSRSSCSALDEPRLATPSPSLSPRPAPATSAAHPVWLGPLPADLHPDEVVALLAPYGHAAFRLHLAETGDGDEAYALEVSCAGREAARGLVRDAREGRVEVRGQEVGLLQEDGSAELEDEQGDEWDEQRGGGGAREEREPSELEGSVRADRGHEEQRSAAAEQYEEQEYLSSKATSPRAFRPRRTSSSPDRLSLANLRNVASPIRIDSTHHSSSKHHAPSRSPSLSADRARTSRAPSHGPLPSPSRARTPRRPAAPAQYRIHPTRLVSPYPRSPSPGEAAWLAVREAEIEKEMDDEVREALRDRWEREGWEKWVERWERAQVVDLTQEDDEEGLEREAERSERMDVDVVGEGSLASRGCARSL